MRILIRLAALMSVCQAFTISTSGRHQPSKVKAKVVHPPIFLHLSNDWSSFTADDDDDIAGNFHTTDYAAEEDSQSTKAQVGATLPAPIVEDDTEPVWAEAGSVLDLEEETVRGVLAACREELGTLFGYTAENRGVGITGGVDFVELDGPSVVISLKGRFWHQRTTVLDRVANYLTSRIPEIIEVRVEDEWQLTDEANEVW